MSKTLVVYHSRSGHTRTVAQTLARRLQAHLEEIRVVRPVEGPIGYALCALESIMSITPALRLSRRDAASYDCIVVGTPVWFWNVSSPVRSWLARRRLRNVRFAFFCTMGGSGAERVFATMTALARAEPVATMALTEQEVASGAKPKIDAFVMALKEAARTRARPIRRAVRPAHARA